MIKAVIFDCFGVLLLESRISFAEKYPSKFDEISEITRQADAGLIDRFKQIQGYSNITGEKLELIEEYLLSTHRLNVSLVKIIKKLKSRYSIGMISNMGADWYERLVSEDTRQLFDATILSGQVRMVKPYPEIFEFTLDKMSLHPAEVIFIDDVLDNCEGAKAIGMEAILYRNVANLEAEMRSHDVVLG